MADRTGATRDGAKRKKEGKLPKEPRHHTPNDTRRVRQLPTAARCECLGRGSNTGSHASVLSLTNNNLRNSSGSLSSVSCEHSIHRYRLSMSDVMFSAIGHGTLGYCTRDWEMVHHQKSQHKFLSNLSLQNETFLHRHTPGSLRCNREWVRYITPFNPHVHTSPPSEHPNTLLWRNV